MRLIIHLTAITVLLINGYGYSQSRPVVGNSIFQGPSLAPRVGVGNSYLNSFSRYSYGLPESFSHRSIPNPLKDTSFERMDSFMGDSHSPGSIPPRSLTRPLVSRINNRASNLTGNSYGQSPPASPNSQTQLYGYSSNSHFGVQLVHSRSVQALLAPARSETFINPTNSITRTVMAGNTDLLSSTLRSPLTARIQSNPAVTSLYRHRSNPIYKGLAANQISPLNMYGRNPVSAKISLIGNQSSGILK